jgi:glucokinase
MTGPGSGAGAGMALGIDIGGTKVLGVVIDGDDRIVAEARVATPHETTEADHRPPVAVGTDVVDAAADVVATLWRSVGASAADGWPVGAGVPGLVDRAGVLRFSPNLPDAAGADVRGLLADRLPGVAPVVENDVNCAAVAEHRLGAAGGATHALVLTLGTGIGAGFIVNGRLDGGRSGFAGEAGHMIVDPTGPPCSCGRRGCWERYASGGGLGRLAREAAHAGRLPDVVGAVVGDPELVRGEDVSCAALAGDAGALAVMADLGWWVALGLANLAALLDPDRIVLGGGLLTAGEILLAPTRRAFADLLEGGHTRPAVPIVPAALGERAGAVGAALAARVGGMW